MFFIKIKSIVNRIRIIYGKSQNPKVDINDYDIIHFHNPLDMYLIRDKLDNYKGKIILTSHSPSLSSGELIDTATEFEKKHLLNLYKKLEKIDVYAFERSDYIVFPCEFAEEPYYHSWKYYKEFKENNKSKFRYLLTGTSMCYAREEKALIRQKLLISSDAFVISYVGRHNSIKGYDILKELASEIFKKCDDIYVLVAGKEGPLYRLENEHWIEVGWTDDPHSYIAASDVFILPNRETYFDLILLEVLSMGQLVIASNTGGTKYFNQFKEAGIFLYETLEEAKSYIYKIKQTPKNEIEKMRVMNEEIYKKYFFDEVFAKNYVELLRGIEKD